MVVFLFIVILLVVSTVVNKLLWGKEITVLEMGVNFLATLVLFSTFWVVSVSFNLADTEIISGKVTQKEISKGSCEHSYSCHCYESCSGSGKDRSCSTHCDTCYDHSYDLSYIVESTIGNYHIARLDSQGLKEPPRYSEVRVDDSVSTTHAYSNYIKGSDRSLFKDHVDFTKEEVKSFPSYPGKIYDYYKIDRIIDQAGLYTAEELKALNAKLSRTLNDLAKEKQVNLVVVLINNTEEYALKLLSYWQGGKKNDVIIVVGIDSSKKINFVRVQSWTTNSLFDVKLRDSILDLESLDKIEKFDQLLQVASDEIRSTYARRAFKEFAYLKWQAMPSDGALTIFVLTALIISTGIGYVFSKDDYSI